MMNQWTFGQRLAAGFAGSVLLSLVIGIVGVYALRAAVASKDRVIEVDSRLLIDAQALHASREAKGSAGRGYLLARDERYLVQEQDARRQFRETLERVKQTVYTDEGRRLTQSIERANLEHEQALQQAISMRQSDAPLDAVVRTFNDVVGPKRELVDAAIQSFVAFEEAKLEQAKEESSDTASRTMWLVAIIAGFAVVFATLAAVVLARTLGRQIGSAVGQVQSSSSELQAAASQQAAAAREQATSMTEISTTISELLATSRQIADSAQRVAKIAEETAGSAQGGDRTVDAAQQSVSAIRRQVDLIVSHMLELGRKSQQIGAILDIVSELAEQTNILAINATIEAVGAGESGRRFSVVADEIRKLAERVGGSTKEVRTLIEDIRTAVNTTVMATETGSKAVDAGSRQFGHVATAFKQIAGMVSTTTEAAREIELSTKQQMTAVEQVNVAIANVAQSSRETEASASQTLQTAGQLAALSRELLRLVRADAAA